MRFKLLALSIFFISLPVLSQVTGGDDPVEKLRFNNPEDIQQLRQSLDLNKDYEIQAHLDRESYELLFQDNFDNTPTTAITIRSNDIHEITLKDGTVLTIEELKLKLINDRVRYREEFDY